MGILVLFILLATTIGTILIYTMFNVWGAIISFGIIAGSLFYTMYLLSKINMKLSEYHKDKKTVK